eukprot:TRINITY_DN7216_c0_g3_i1.p1 TRINITY_DN7216_c0_g3~~TRINITY_DN7216_c0_g3_i1.p1  ORF type:complete len:962 (-),score=98.92 TRINITY_DN7216_c0_g3_i1:244-3129(-)
MDERHPSSSPAPRERRHSHSRERHPSRSPAPRERRPSRSPAPRERRPSCSSPAPDRRPSLGTAGEDSPLPRERRRRACRYGVACYRRNAEHREQFSHPGDDDYQHDAPAASPGRARSRCDDKTPAHEAHLSPSSADHVPDASADLPGAAASSGSLPAADHVPDASVHLLGAAAPSGSLPDATPSVEPIAASVSVASIDDDEAEGVRAKSTVRLSSLEVVSGELDRKVSGSDSESFLAANVARIAPQEPSAANILPGSAGEGDHASEAHGLGGPHASPPQEGDQPGYYHVVVPMQGESVADVDPADDYVKDMAQPIDIGSTCSSIVVRPDNFIGRHKFLKGCMGTCCLGLLIFVIIVCTCIKVVYEDEQLLTKTTTGRSTRDGPFVDVIWPHKRVELRKALRLAELEFASVKDDMTMQIRHQPGPGLVFLGPYEVLLEVLPKTQLALGEYMRLIDKMTGSERVVSGPEVLVPNPLEESPLGVEQAVVVNASTTVTVEKRTSGMRRLVTQLGPFVPAAYEVILALVHARTLEQMKYLRVKDHLTGQVRHVPGPQLFFLGPYDEILSEGQKIVLGRDEYVRLLSQSTGLERIVQGPEAVVPDAMELVPEGIQKGVSVNENTAVLVLNKATGQQRLITTRGIFIPEPHDHVVESRQKLQVLPHQALLTRDAAGGVHLHTSNTSAPISFFLQPYFSLIKLYWSSSSQPGVSEPPPKEEVTVIDLRVQHQRFFSFEARTDDGVTLMLEGAIFWQVKDVLKMLRVTSDAPADVSQRAKAALLQSISRMSLRHFMTNFRKVCEETSAIESSDQFFTKRGLELHSIDVTKYSCVDPEASRILQSMVAEVTSGVNRLQRAQSEADVKQAELLGLLELEKKRTTLIEAKAINIRLEAASRGRVKGSELSASAQTFLDGLNATDVKQLAQRLDLYRRQEIGQSNNLMTDILAASHAQSYLKMSEVKLSFKGEL